MVAGGRGNAARSALVTAGVGVGVTLLLLVLTALPALQHREDRTAWHGTSAATAVSSADPLWWLASRDHYRGRDVLRVYVAAAGPASQVPPGLTGIPGPGQVAASPALVQLLKSAPADELAARLPGPVTATIGPAGLASPDELVAIVGATPEQVRAWGGVEVHGLADRPTTITVNGYLRTMLIIMAAGLLVPVVVFIGLVTRIDATRRERRLAAIRLVGGTNGQVAAITAIETGLAATAGAVAGWLGYLAARPVVATLVTFDGMHFYPADVTASTAQLVAVLVAVPLAATLAAAAALQRVRISPLGVTRGAGRRPPGWWRLAVPGAGVAGFGLTAVLRGAGVDANSAAIQLVTAASLLLVLVGLVVAGAWVCLAVARTLAHRARHAPALMAARRLAADPQATFRAIAGVVLATFVTGMFAGVAPDPNTKALESLQLRPGVVEILTEGQPAGPVAELGRRLGQIPGVSRVLTVRTGDTDGTIAVDCADLATAVNLTCAKGQPVWTSTGLPPHGLQRIRGLTPSRDDATVHALYVFTGDGPAGEDRIRTATALLLPAAQTDSRTDQVQLDTRQLRELNTGLRTGAAFVMLVGACSLTVAAVGGLIERRRPFALLRATGVHLSELRSAVLTETAVPLAVTVVAGALLGVLASAVISDASGQSWQPPGLTYLLTTAAGLAAAIAVTAVTIPFINATTRSDAVQFT